ncbi:hypothetical protein LZ554_004810 [Drepanopeziza brunnea f. sp. 'monogermtubi']|nr:hypothetical protein LZ554_004810 [Drepanopeziza brunnea f. sp. 'monogermtubi']
MPQSNSTFGILLALSLLLSTALAVPWPDLHRYRIIGYTVVAPERAELINADNKPVIDDNIYSELNNQLGKGLYLVAQSEGNGSYNLIHEDKAIVPFAVIYDLTSPMYK